MFVLICKEFELIVIDVRLVNGFLEYICIEVLKICKGGICLGILVFVQVKIC